MEEYTVNDMCKHYNVTRTTVERWYKKYGMPCLKRGRRVYFIVADVEKWFEEKNKEVKYNYEKNLSN